jgi:uncharacterized membrane protein (UPF0127 family)
MSEIRDSAQIYRSDDLLIPQAKWCASFGRKLRGFTFTRRAPVWPPQTAADALVLVETSDGRLNTSIHMLFVSFDLGVVWVNSAGEVVDTVLAKSWRPSYAPQAPARYVIEAHPAILEHVRVGDRIRFEAVIV